MTISVDNLNLEELLRWGKPFEVPTKHGPRILRKGRPNEAFWIAWRANRSALSAAGLQLEQGIGGAQVLWWQTLPKEELERRQQSLESSRATSVEIEIPKPEGEDYRPFQKAGIIYATQRAATYFADEMGLGKTIQAIGFINATPSVHRVLIFTKSRLKVNWYRELRKWLVRPLTIGIADAQVFPSTDIVIINYDVAHKYPKRLEMFWDLVVLDEAHYIKNRNAKRTKAIVGYKPNRKEANEGKLPTSGIPARRRIAISGTPIENTIHELFTVINYLWPEKFPSRSKFETQWCESRRGAYGWTMSGPRNLEKLQTILRETGMIRRLKRDVLKELPPKTRMIVTLEADGMQQVLKMGHDAFKLHEATLVEAQATYELAKAAPTEQDFKAQIASLRQKTKVAFEEMARIRHEEALAMVPQAIELLKEEIEEEGNKILVFAHHRDVLEALHRAFPKSLLMHGDTKPEEGQRAVDEFQRDNDSGPFFGSIRATGEGLTLTKAKLVVFVEEDWVPGRITQCEDRAHRIGQTDNVLCKHYVANGSINANMAVTCVAKQEIADKVLDDQTKAQLIAEPNMVASHKSLATAKQIEIEAAVVTEEQCVVVHHCLKQLAAVPDELQPVDLTIANMLAGQMRVTEKQAVLGRKIVLRYSELLSAELVKKCGGFQGEKQ